MKKLLSIAAAAASMLATANAAIVFEENFDDDTAGSSVLNFTGFSDFDVTDGVVDIVKSGEFSITCADGTGYCIDLDGSQPGIHDPASVITTKSVFDFKAGYTYTLSFDYSGNQRNTDLDGMRVFIGSILDETIDDVPGDPSLSLGFTTATYVFSVVADTSAALSFSGLRKSDNIGIILDNVKLEYQAVPVPAALPLFVVALAGGAALRRRKSRA